MTINELARMVHENAVEHGWWEDDRSDAEIDALIHSEWSEALEEARAGRPMAYIEASVGSQRDPATVLIERDADGRYIYFDKEYHAKPEGIAVELIDGCIRILDYLGYMNASITDADDIDSDVETLYSAENQKRVPEALPEMVAELHAVTSAAYGERNLLTGMDVFKFLTALAAALSWVAKQGLDPLAILLEKHAYNVTRPYKHGKRF